MTKSPVGVNGIDPARQGIDPFPQVIKERSIAVFTEQNGSIDRISGESGESLVNRANAIRPYTILHLRSHLKRNAIWVTLFLDITSGFLDITSGIHGLPSSGIVRCDRRLSP